MLFQSFQCIGGTGGLITAIEPYPRAKNKPVSSHGDRQNVGKNIHGLVCSFCKATESSACIATKLVLAVTLARPIKT